MVYGDVSWRMFQKRGLTCEMVKMWMTRESSDCFFVAAVLCGRSILGSKRLILISRKNSRSGCAGIVKPRWV